MSVANGVLDGLRKMGNAGGRNLAKIGPALRKFSENGEKGRNGEKKKKRAAATRGGFGEFGRVLVRRRGSEKRRTDDE